MCVCRRIVNTEIKISWPTCSPEIPGTAAGTEAGREALGGHSPWTERLACPGSGATSLQLGLAVPADARLGFIYKVAEGIHLQGAA